MQLQVVTSLLVACLASNAFAATNLLDCHGDKAIAYKAELAGVGDGRAVAVSFSKKPSSVTAAKIVEQCMRVVVARDGTHELLGSAWVGETQFPLAPGEENLVYFPNEKKIRPFGLDEAIRNLKRK